MIIVTARFKWEHCISSFVRICVSGERGWLILRRIVTLLVFAFMRLWHNYRPQQSCEVYVFTSVCLSTGEEYLTRYPPGTRYTPDQVQPPGPGTLPLDQVHPPGTRYTPPDQVHPLGPGTPPRPGTPPWDQVNPPPSPRYGYCCGRYASYWNAFWLIVKLWKFNVLVLGHEWWTIKQEYHFGMTWSNLFFLSLYPGSMFHI